MGEDSLESKEKPSATLPGTVEKIFKPIGRHEPEKAQIDIHGAEDLYREIRIDNTLTNEQGEEVSLKEGANVEVTIEADRKDTIKSKVVTTA
jgi:predicted DNA-binding antitoxin AbrB/MazE fold protein